MESYNFSGGTVSLMQPTILLIEYKVGKLITVKDIFELNTLTAKLMGKEYFHTITDAKDGTINFSDEAKAVFAEDSPYSRQRLSDAIIVNSFTKRIEVELYMKFNKPAVRTKAFNNLNSALVWSESLKKDTLELT